MNDECRSLNDERMSKSEARLRKRRPSTFELRHSFVIQASTFDIPAGLDPPAPENFPYPVR
jgi:hypothetical protein